MLWIWVALGGSLGSLLRYALQGKVHSAFPGAFPMGTLAVNLIGSTLIGILAAVFALAGMPAATAAQGRVFLMAGVLGGFTTFSAFTLENVELLRAGEWRMALLYLLSSNVLGVLLAFGGYLAARSLLRPA
jgi:fluoride exporter